MMLVLVIAILSLLFTNVLSTTKVISTYVGTGVGGNSGKNGPASSAKIYYPRGVAIDSSGNLYVGDGYSNSISKVTRTTGVYKYFAGTGTEGTSGDGGAATSALLRTPSCVAIDPTTGDVYFVDTGNNRVRKVDIISGIITAFLGAGECVIIVHRTVTARAVLCSVLYSVSSLSSLYMLRSIAFLSTHSTPIYSTSKCQYKTTYKYLH